MRKNPTVKDKIFIALAAGMSHTDSIALHADTSEAHCRQVLNKMSDDGEITKECGRAHHTYNLKTE